MEEIYRRFELINKENEKKLNQLINEKGLTRDDLTLILKTIKLTDI